MNTIVKTTGKIINETIVTGASVAAGATATIYCVDHDICNNSDQSLIAGAVAGGIVTTTSSLILRSIENRILLTGCKIKEGINRRKAKKEVN